MPKQLRVSTPNDREILIERGFAAPRESVFKAFTTPELLKRWLGVHNGWVLAECEYEARKGGRFRYLWRGPSGEAMGMRGVCLEFDAPERIVSTEKFDHAWYAGDAIGTVTFKEENGRTTVRTSVRYDSKEVRDAVLLSPMDQGMESGYMALDALLVESVNL